MKTMGTCAYCGQAIHMRYKAKKYCNRKCQAAAQRLTVNDFWAKVEKTDSCWLWRSTVCSEGYGVVQWNGRQQKAHRVAYDLTHDEPLGERLGCHSCDNPLCVRPDHIWPGTVNDNIQDMIRKGRARQITGEPRRRRGTQNGRAKLTEQDVIEMRRRYAAGESVKALAAEYGVSQAQGRRAIKGKFWTHIADDTSRHWRGQADYDPSAPQPHMHFIREAR